MNNAATLQRAIEYLDATQVAPDRYAYRDDATQSYYVVRSEDLEALEDCYDYSRWCADTQAVEMPAWWTPETRFAWRNALSAPEDPLPGDVFPGRAGWRLDHSMYPERITVDYTTGKEIPA